MGKWSTYRKRGSGEPAITGPPATPTPFLIKVGSYAEQLSSSASDVGGSIEIERSYDAGITWYLVSTNAWQAVHDWAIPGYWAGNLLRCYETGNAIDYIGVSPYSNTIVWS